MSKIRSLLTVVTVMLIVACGGSPETSQAEVTPPVPEATPEAPATAESTEIAPVEESAADPDESATANEDKIVLAQADAGSAPQQYSEGQHYGVLAIAQGTSSSPDVIEVAEIFWYGCPHCYNFDPYITNWEKELPDGVELVRLPVMWNPTNEIHARAFYTAEALGKLDEMHTEIFKEMHVNKKTLTTEADIEEFFERFGVSEEEFNDTFRSFQVETALTRARKLTQRYRIQSVPLLVVNGKYVTNGKGIKNFDDMIAVANELVAREQQEL